MVSLDKWLIFVHSFFIFKGYFRDKVIFRKLNIGIKKIKTTTGYMFVSEPELTLYDLIKYPEAAGYLNNIATVRGGPYNSDS